MPRWRRAGSADLRLEPVRWWHFGVRRERRESDLGPNGGEEHLFVPLVRSEPGMYEELRSRWAAHWVVAAGFPDSRHAEAEGVLDLRVAPDEHQLRQLRATSTFSGSTTWLRHWNGDLEAARRFIDEFAESEGGWVHDERRLEGPTEWDDPL
jgi:hypothetical protein